MTGLTVDMNAVGVRGAVPAGWRRVDDGVYARQGAPGDPTILHQRAVPHAEPRQVRAIMAAMAGLDRGSAPVGTLRAGGYAWEHSALDLAIPERGALRVDLCTAQEGTWTYVVLLAALPHEHKALHDDVLLPALHAFTPLTERFGLINGGVPADGEGPALAEQLGYGADDVLLIVHADDMAAHADQTDGALDAMAAGVCRSGSVMAPCPDFSRTLATWQAQPELDLGIHLTLNSEWGARYGWGGVLPQSQVPSLYNDDGILWPTSGELAAHMDVGEALREMEAQIVRVLQAGVQPTHIDDHMGCYWLHPALGEGAMDLARTYNLPMNPIHIADMRVRGYVCADAVWMFHANVLIDRLEPSARAMVYDDWLRALQPGVHLLLIHAARMSDAYRARIPDATIREGDHAYWTRPETRALVEELGIVPLGYRALQRLQARRWGLPTDGVQVR
ncbi:MAG: ChbG/HpnK family deacetylase [Anaerolineae bacterium]|nr:ChbG/HpnK family deacetylase [Anaerolineae bacterium]